MSQTCQRRKWIAHSITAQRPTFRRGAIKRLGQPRSIAASKEASACPMIGALVTDRVSQALRARAVRLELDVWKEPTTPIHSLRVSVRDVRSFGDRVSMRRAFIVVAMLFSATAVEAAPRVLGGSLGYREFSLPRNSVCLIKRQGILGMTLVSMKIAIRPKLGQFGSASISEYRAGNVAGDDYFEYISSVIQRRASA
jgi:hypothetical protein